MNDVYELSIILQYIEKHYENVLTNAKIFEIKEGLDNLERK